MKIMAGKKNNMFFLLLFMSTRGLNDGRLLSGMLSQDFSK